jgi:thioredoxin-related protein
MAQELKIKLKLIDMKKVLGILAIALVLTSWTNSSETIWLTDLENAQTQATEEDKLILLSFSGSDWCGNCIRLEKTLFDNESFGAYAQEHLVLLNADFPMRKANKLSEEQTKKNEALAEKYNKKGTFPTVVILDASGNELGRLPNPKESAEAYLTELKKLVH